MKPVDAITRTIIPQASKRTIRRALAAINRRKAKVERQKEANGHENGTRKADD